MTKEVISPLYEHRQEHRQHVYVLFYSENSSLQTDL